MTTRGDENQPEISANARREALKKMAVFGAYTAPVMLGMLTATKAVGQSTAPGGGGGGRCPPTCSYD